MPTIARGLDDRPITASIRAGRRGGPACLVLAVAFAALLGASRTAESAPLLTFGFETTQGGNPFGQGSFTIDAAVFPYPHVVIGAFPNAADVFVDFSYSDPHAGVFGLADVASVHFEIGIDPNTSQWSPAISLWAFVIANFDNSRVLIGSVSGLDPLGNLNTQSIVQDPQLGPIVEFLTVKFPQRVVPEPATVLLLGTAVGGWFARRRTTRRP